MIPIKTVMTLSSVTDFSILKRMNFDRYRWIDDDGWLDSFVGDDDDVKIESTSKKKDFSTVKCENI